MISKMEGGALGILLLWLILSSVMVVGCAVPVKTEVCPPVVKCPPSYVGLYEEEQRAADRLEDALRESQDGSRACVREFEDGLRKSSR